MNAMPCDAPGNIVNTINVIDVVDNVDEVDDLDDVGNLDNVMAWTVLTTSQFGGRRRHDDMMTLTTMTIIRVQLIPGMSLYTVTGYWYLYEKKRYESVSVLCGGYRGYGGYRYR